MVSVLTWTADDVADWLERSLNVPCAAVFRQKNIHGRALINLNDEGLTALGVEDPTQLLRILGSIWVFRTGLGLSLLGPDGGASNFTEPCQRHADSTYPSREGTRRPLSARLVPVRDTHWMPACARPAVMRHPDFVGSAFPRRTSSQHMTFTGGPQDWFPHPMFGPKQQAECSRNAASSPRRATSEHPAYPQKATSLIADQTNLSADPSSRTGTNGFFTPVVSGLSDRNPTTPSNCQTSNLKNTPECGSDATTKSGFCGPDFAAGPAAGTGENLLPTHLRRLPGRKSAQKIAAEKETLLAASSEVHPKTDLETDPYELAHHSMWIPQRRIGSPCPESSRRTINDGWASDCRLSASISTVAEARTDSSLASECETPDFCGRDAESTDDCATVMSMNESSTDSTAGSFGKKRVVPGQNKPGSKLIGPTISNQSRRQRSQSGNRNRARSLSIDAYRGAAVANCRMSRLVDQQLIGSGLSSLVCKGRSCGSNDSRSTDVSPARRAASSCCGESDGIDSEFGHDRRPSAPFKNAVPRTLIKNQSPSPGPSLVEPSIVSQAKSTRFCCSPRKTTEAWTKIGIETAKVALYMPISTIGSSLANHPGAADGSRSKGSVTPRRSSCSKKFSNECRKDSSELPGPGEYTPRYRSSSRFK